MNETVEPYAAVHETHSGVVVLLGDHAYKVKRPVRLGFLDFSTIQVRRAMCEREVELNRQFAPDVYLGVAALRGPDGIEEPAVAMRRMPEDTRLAQRVRDGADVDDVVRTVARQMAAFHSRARRSPEVDAEGTRDAIRRRWAANIAQVREHGTALVGAPLLDEIETRVQTFLAGRAPLFDERVRRGRIVDGHGDLLADDIFCLDDGPRILDCLEFDDRLRYVDGLDDIAFLAMDLEWLGEPRLADLFVATYLEMGGDPAPPALVHHFIAYRAFVRAMVSCLHGAALHGTAGHQASGFAELAARHLRAGTVTLVLVGGPPGSGKTTLAGDVADRMGYTMISSDRVRKELAGIAPESSARAPLHEGIYSHGHTRATYDEILARAESLLARGESVVLDASWTDPEDRETAASVARLTSSRLVSLRCSLDEERAAARIFARTGISDADDAIAAALRHEAAPWPGSIPIDTTRRREECAELAAEALDLTPSDV